MSKDIEEYILTKSVLSTVTGPLAEAIRYAIIGGKYLRPRLAESLISSFSDATRDCCIAVEFFHAASLVIDDLPVFDAASIRRGQFSVHAKYGQATAQLVAISLVSLGMQSCARGLKTLGFKESTAVDVFELVSSELGPAGIATGQFMDLYMTGSEKVKTTPTVTNLENMIYGKTGSFFAMAFGIGWILNGGDSTKLELVKTMAKEFGMGFQLVDDIEDYDDDTKHGRIENWAVTFGIVSAKERCRIAIQTVTYIINQLDISNEVIVSSLKWMTDKSG